jgi:hypothetical protein
MANGRLTHRDIPDHPVVESERRQIFFAAAMGVPTVYVRRSTRNRLMRMILEQAEGTRPSRRYPGYLRIRVDDYRRGLLRVILNEGSDLIEMLGMGETIEDLAARLENTARLGAADRLTKGILDEIGARSAINVHAPDFNRGAESFYRNTLRIRHLNEALSYLEERLTALDKEGGTPPTLTGGCGGADYLRRVRRELLDERLPAEQLRVVIGLLLACEADESRRCGEMIRQREATGHDGASVHRA